jgi:hypothetical protein
MRKLGFACIFAGLLLIAGSAFLYWQERQAAGRVPPAVAEFERSLARPGLLALATLDVQALARLGVAGEDAGEGADADSLAALLSSAGIDPYRDVRYTALALGTGSDGQPDVALALFGSFDAAAVEQALGARDDFRLRRAQAAGEPVLQVVRIDRESCDESGPWALHVRPDRLLIAETDAIAEILEGGASSEAALRDVARFQAFRAGRLVSAAVFIPDELPQASNPLVGMAAQGAKQQVDGFRALYAGAAPQLLPAGLAVDAVLEGTRSGVAAEKAAAWQAWLDQRLARLGDRVPTLSTLHEALDLSADGDDLHASFRLSREDLERLRRLPGELGSLVFGGSSFEVGVADVPDEEMLAQDPPVFEAQVSEASLPAYDPSVLFAEPVDQGVGPFGLRLSAMRLLEGEQGEDGPGELEVEAFATRVPNLGDSEERVAIRITGVESRAGDELLARERCGPDRNELPALLSNAFGGEVLRGSKSVRLREGARPDDVARIVGVATLRLPTRTEVVKLPAEPGAVERAGTRLELTQVKGGTVSYRLGGATDGLLKLRALNSAGRILADESATSSSGFGGGISGSRSFAGRIHALEAVFALEQREIRYPFELTGSRPGTAGELVATEPAAPTGGAVHIRGKLQDWLARTARPVALARATGDGGSESPVARAGPFSMRLEGLWPFGGLMPRIEVRSPPIPGLVDNPSALELRLSELHLLDGTVQRGDWRETLDMSEEFGGDALVGTSQLETGVSASPGDVASLHGILRIRLPARVRGEELARADLGAALETPALSLRLVELGRDRFVLRATRGGERLLGAQAYNGDDLPLFTQHEGSQTTPAGALELAFQVRGVPRRIELRVADQLAEAEYPFVLSGGDRTVALAP